MKIEDIAKLAGVSTSAVSLALNHKPGVSEETRDLIFKIANENNYVPLRSASKKRITENKIIRFVACKNKDIVTNDFENLPFFNELIGFLSLEMGNYPYSLIITSVNTDNIVHQLSEYENEQPSEGIILLGTNLSIEQIQKVKSVQKNTVILDTNYLFFDSNFICINNYQGAYEAGLHLINSGHKKIGYAQSKTRIYNFEERKRGFFNALETKNLSVPKHHLFDLPAMEIGFKTEDFAYLGTSTNLPSAIFCENDYIAISMIKTLTEIGINVPEDISIIGFDDISEAKVVTPELTTIQVNKKQLTVEALKQVIREIKEPQSTKSHTFINCSLIERNSVKRIDNTII